MLKFFIACKLSEERVGREEQRRRERAALPTSCRRPGSRSGGVRAGTPRHEDAGTPAQQGSKEPDRDPERRLYLSDLETLLELLKNEHDVAMPDPDA